MLALVLLLLQFTAVPRLIVRLFLDRRVPLASKLVLPAALVYIVFPIDLVPDIIAPLGLIDDVVVLLGSIAIFLAIVPGHLVAEHMRQIRGGARAGGQAADSQKPQAPVVEGRYRIVDDEEEADG